MEQRRGAAAWDETALRDPTICAPPWKGGCPEPIFRRAPPVAGRPAGAYPEDWGLMKILVVDDSPSMRTFIGGALESAFGAEITEGSDRLEAL